MIKSEKKFNYEEEKKKQMGKKNIHFEQSDGNDRK